MKAYLKIVCILAFMGAALPKSNGDDSPAFENAQLVERVEDAKTGNIKGLSTFSKGNDSILPDLNSGGLNSSSMTITEKSKWPTLKEVMTTPINDTDEVKMAYGLSPLFYANPDYITNLMTLFGVFDDFPIREDLTDEEQKRLEDLQNEKQQLKKEFEELKPKWLKELQELRRNVTANENGETEA